MFPLHASTKMKIQFQFLRQDLKIEMDFSLSTTIETIISAIAQKQNVKPEFIKLLLKQTILRPQQTVEEAKITENSTINVLIKQGGQQNSTKMEEPKPKIQSPIKEEPQKIHENKDRLEAEKDQEPLPKSYLSTLRQGSSVVYEQPKHVVSSNQPIQIQQQSQTQQELAGDTIPPEMIMALENNPLLPDYVEDLVQNPDRVEKALENPKLQQFLKMFFGDDPMAVQSLKNPKVFAQLMSDSLRIFKNAPARQPPSQQQVQQLQQTQQQVQDLKQKWQKQLQQIRDMGVNEPEGNLLKLLEQYNGDVQAVLNVLWGQ